MRELFLRIVAHRFAYHGGFSFDQEIDTLSAQLAEDQKTPDSARSQMESAETAMNTAKAGSDGAELTLDQRSLSIMREGRMPD